MRFEIMGTYNVKGRTGVYLVAIDEPSEYRYTSCDYRYLPYEYIPRKLAGRIIDLPISREELVNNLDYLTE